MAVNIDDLLRRAVETSVGLAPESRQPSYLRVTACSPAHGRSRITPEEMLSMAFSMMTTAEAKFKETAELDMAYASRPGRFRVNVFQQRGNVGMVLRVIPTKSAQEELNLPPVISKICEEQRGLVLVTGTTVPVSPPRCCDD